jgi:hypothetical protein
VVETDTRFGLSQMPARILDTERYLVGVELDKGLDGNSDGEVAAPSNES